MALQIGLQRALNRFQFERTVDWRVSFPELPLDLKGMGGKAESVGKQMEDILFEGTETEGHHWVYATQCSFIPGMVTTQATNSIQGYYDSKLSFPNPSVTLYLDANMVIEQALQIWCASSFLANGCMPLIPKGTSRADRNSICREYQIANPVQKIRVERIRPFRISKAFASLIYDVPGSSSEILGKIPGVSQAQDWLNRNRVSTSNVMEWYDFYAYLAGEPKFSGNEQASFRTATLTFNVVEFERKFPMTRGETLSTAEVTNSLGKLDWPEGNTPETLIEAFTAENAEALAGFTNNQLGTIKGEDTKYRRGR